GFEGLCAQFPALQPWRSASEPTSKVLGAGAFANTWQRFGTAAGRELLGFLALGDAHIETNPMYGRGCSQAFVQAEALAEALAASSDPAERARRYYARVHAELYAVFVLSANTDRLYHVRAKLRRGQPVPLPDRVLSYLYDHAFMAANYESLLVARE